MSGRIDEILKQRQQPAAEPETKGDKFYSVLLADGLQENFLELQFRNGLQTCFSYSDLLWFSHDPEAGCIDLEFGGFLITIKGRGLRTLFAGVKNKRVAWVKEADSELQDHEENESFVEGITITPPSDFSGGENSEQ